MVDADGRTWDWERLLAQTEWLGRLAAQLVPATERDDLVHDVLLTAVRRDREPQRTRAWLATVARNLASRRRRREQHRRARELATAPGEASAPATVDVVAGFATHRTVVDAVMALDEPYRTAVLLRFWEDLPLREVARRTGVPTETARTRVKRGIDRLRARLDAGGRRAWLLPLLQIDAVRRALSGGAMLPTAASLLTGVLLMKYVLALVVAAVLVGAVVWFSPATPPPVADAGKATAAASPAAAAAPGVAATPDLSSRTVVPTAAAGAVIARVSYADGKPLAGAALHLSASDAARPFEQRTDRDGVATFADLRAGSYMLRLDQRAARSVDVRAGRIAECRLELPRGLLVHGKVVTKDGQPVAGASVYTFVADDPDGLVPLATTAADGTFELRDLASGTVLLARASGWQPSRGRGRAVSGPAGKLVQVELQLGARGHRLRGRVLDAAGAPVAHALVVVAVDEDCRKRLEGLNEVRRADGNGKLDREAFLLHAGADGAFESDQVPWGDVVVLARGRGAQAAMVGGTHTAVARRGDNPDVVVRLQPGASIVGTLRDVTGQPGAGVMLRASYDGSEDFGELDRDLESRLLADRTCVVQPDGSFAITGLLPATYDLRAVLTLDDQRLQKVTVAAGQQLRVDLQTERLWQLRIRARDPAGEPLQGWSVVLSAGGSIAFAQAARCLTDAAGTFVATGLRAERYVLSLHAPDPHGEQPVLRLPSWVQPVARGDGEVIIVASPPTASLRARVVEAEGMPAAKAAVQLRLVGFDEQLRLQTDADGRFATELLPAGEFELRIQSHGPELLRTFAVASMQAIDLGDVQLDAAAPLHVTVRGAGDTGRLDFQLLQQLPDAATGTLQWAVIQSGWSADGSWRCDRAAAGSYLLQVSGTEIAPVLREVQLTAAAPLRLDLECQRGTAQPFDVVLSDPEPRTRGEGYAWLTIEDGRGRPLVEHYFRGRITDPANMLLHTEVRLLPGSYRVLARDRSGHAEAHIVVGATGGEPIHIRLH